MKKIVLIAGMILFSIAVSQAFDTIHVYINGKVNAVSGNTITIDGNQYVIDAKCKVVVVSEEKGIFHESPARVFNIDTGDTVTAKKIANTLYEIMIERWRR